MGGGPEDPISDVLAVGTLFASLGSLIFGKHKPPDIQPIEGDKLTQQIQTLKDAISPAAQANATTGKAITTAVAGSLAGMLGGVKGTPITSANIGTLTSQYNAQFLQKKVATQKLIDSLTNAQSRGQSVYSVKPVNGGARRLVISLKPEQLTRAISSVKANPSAFVGVDTRVLSAMGLNNALATKAGAEAVIATSKIAEDATGATPTAGTTLFLGPMSNLAQVQGEAQLAMTPNLMGTEKTQISQEQIAGGIDKNNYINSMLALSKDTGNSSKANTDLKAMLVAQTGMNLMTGLSNTLQRKLDWQQGVTDSGVNAQTTAINAQAVLINQQNYIDQENAYLTTVTDAPTKKYLQYKLNLWKFNNGVAGATKPTQVTPPMTATSMAAVKAWNEREASAKAKEVTAKANLASAQANESTSQTALSKANTALNSAKANTVTQQANQAVINTANATQLAQAQSQLAQNATQAQAYNEWLSQTMENDEILSSVNAVDMANATGQAVKSSYPGHYGTFDATAQYKKYALQGTTVKAPTDVLLGITQKSATNFAGVNVSTSLRDKYNKILANPALPPPKITGISSASASSNVSSTAPVKVNYGTPLKSAAGSRGPVKAAPQPVLRTVKAS